jgi:hypothetical protein
MSFADEFFQEQRVVRNTVLVGLAALATLYAAQAASTITNYFANRERPAAVRTEDSNLVRGAETSLPHINIAAYPASATTIEFVAGDEKAIPFTYSRLEQLSANDYRVRERCTAERAQETTLRLPGVRLVDMLPKAGIMTDDLGKYSKLTFFNRQDGFFVDVDIQDLMANPNNYVVLVDKDALQGGFPAFRFADNDGKANNSANFNGVALSTDRIFGPGRGYDAKYVLE